MSRAMLLPTPGDPYICSMWINSYKKYCQRNIDKLYVLINSPVDTPVYNYVINLFKEINAEVIHYDNFIGHGHALTELLERCKEDYVFISEDDFYLQEGGWVDEWFGEVESNRTDMIVSTRGSAHPTLNTAIGEYYDLSPAETEEPNFWPSLFVGKRKDLQKTDKDFEAKTFKAGEYIKEIDYTPPINMSSDTFGWMSMQLRAMGLRYKKVKQWRLIDIVINKLSNPPWVHLGSGSTSLNSHLFNPDMTVFGNKHKAGKKEQALPKMTDKKTKVFFEQKFAWWKIASIAFPISENSPASYFNSRYQEAIDNTIEKLDLDMITVEENMYILKHVLQPSLTR